MQKITESLLNLFIYKRDDYTRFAFFDFLLILMKILCLNKKKCETIFHFNISPKIHFYQWPSHLIVHQLPLRLRWTRRFTPRLTTQGRRGCSSTAARARTGSARTRTRKRKTRGS